MNLTEFAEQVVFGTTLEDKLLVPGKLTDTEESRKGPNVVSLIAPGRPTGLQMRLGNGENVQPPADETLENEQARGQLLHFLANHELLATELMALVLLKFPEAPRAFRQGVFVTLQEEQEHTRMYIRRMKECGVEFGSYPLSGQFWRVIEPMQSPMDFVSRLSLTFEQANLDFSQHFANVFRKIGDIETSDVLQKIYEDEIGHVRHGLHWFRQWKDPQQSDWEAYQDALEFPMSPQRGRGPQIEFNREGRKRAGMTDDFIDAIEVFRRSRGRAATVRWFDPAAEAELAGEQSSSWAESASEMKKAKGHSLLRQLGIDLELVMVPMSKPDDIVLVRRMPSLEFRKRLIDVGFDLPEFTCFGNRAELVDRKLHDFSPWAWTPRNHQVAEPLIQATRHTPQPWSNDSVDLFRKSWSTFRFKEWLEEEPDQLSIQKPDWFADVDCAGVPVNSIGEVSTALAELKSRGFSKAIFKRDLSASGRGQRRLNCEDSLDEQDRAWLRSTFAYSAANAAISETAYASRFSPPPVGIVEPQLKRRIDLSFLWHLTMGNSTAKFLGWTQPLVTDGRRYVGTKLGHALSDCDDRLRRFLLEDRQARLQTVQTWLEERIVHELVSRNFSGHFGIDAFVYQQQEGRDELKIKPIVELNPRMTMGHVALRLGKRLAKGVIGVFRILSRTEWLELGDKLNTIPVEFSPTGHWKSGVIWLSEIDERTKLIPVVLVGAEAIAMAPQFTNAS